MAPIKMRTIGMTTFMAALLALAACGDKSANPGTQDASAAPHTYHSSAPESSPRSTAASHNKKELQISSGSADTSSKPTPQPSAAAKKDSGKAQLPDYNVTSPYDASKPTLMGFTVGSKLDAVTHRFGKPTGTYKMDDPQAPLNVYEFPGFSFGFDKNNQVVFINVSSQNVNPGLNGVRLGQTVQEATDALGQPDTNTEFVIAYKSGGVVLKLDVDPAYKTITSIKLFAE